MRGLRILLLAMALAMVPASSAFARVARRGDGPIIALLSVSNVTNTAATIRTEIFPNGTPAHYEIHVDEIVPAELVLPRPAVAAPHVSTEEFPGLPRVEPTPGEVLVAEGWIAPFGASSPFLSVRTTALARKTDYLAVVDATNRRGTTEAAKEFETSDAKPAA